MINKHVGVAVFAEARCALGATRLRQLLCTLQCGVVTAQRTNGNLPLASQCRQTPAEGPCSSWRRPRALGLPSQLR